MESRVRQQSPRTRTCWYASDLSGAVMFRGHYNHEFMTHSHDVLTVILVTGGTVQIDVDGMSYCVGKGQFVVIGAHQVHSARPVDEFGWKMRSLHLRPDVLARYLGVPSAELRNIYFSKPVHSAATPAGSLFFNVHYCSEVEGPLDEREDRFRAFLLWLSNNLEMLGPRTRNTYRNDERAELAMRILSETIFENISIEQLARHVGLSPFSLIRRFRKNFGFCPHTWRMQVRANEVARLLESRTSLAEAADACGFSDQAHMARVFKKVFGVTPGQYGSMHRAGHLR